MERVKKALNYANSEFTRRWPYARAIGTDDREKYQWVALLSWPRDMLRSYFSKRLTSTSLG